MDDRQEQPPRQSPPRRDDSPGGPRDKASSGGLLSRYRAGAPQGDDAHEPEAHSGGAAFGGSSGRGNSHAASDESAGSSASRPQGGGLLSRFARASQAWDAVAGQVRRATDGARQQDRRPAPSDWRASDYAPEELEALISTADDEVDPDGGHDGRHGERGYDRRGYAQAGRGGRAGRRFQDDERDWERDWDAGWETGTWDTGWATDWSDQEDGRDGGWGDGGAWDDSTGYEDDEWSRPTGPLTLARLPMGRVARVRMIMRERPATGALLIVFLVGFALTCLAPLLPLLRLGWDVADAARRANNILGLVKGGNTTQLLQPANLKLVQNDVDSIEHDLYEINAFTNVAGAPFAKLSHTARDLRLLVRIGYDLTGAADEGIQVGQTLLTPLQGGVFSAGANNPGITPADIHQARALLADAKSRVQDAVAAYALIDQAALPSQLRPGSRYGAYLALLPVAPGMLDELDTLLAIAPALLGVGQPAYYLVVAMDRSELRPGGGFQGNYGLLELAGGKQPADRQLSLKDTYGLDIQYYEAALSNDAKLTLKNCDTSTIDSHPEWWGPEPPSYFWWWPFRNFSCQFNWGLRDSNLSPDFPTNARTAISIAEQAGQVPVNANGTPGQIQGVVAFTPALIEDLLRIPGLGPISLPQYPKDPPITAENLEEQIHCHQLQNACTYVAFGQNRKLFTHFLSQALLAKIKTLHGSGLKQVVSAALLALKTKDLEVYFSDPRAELILQQLGLASQIGTAGGDGYFVVDTNDGGNKANLYVTEHQEDVVTLLPNGGAIHRLQVTITYAYPKGPAASHSQVYADIGTAEDYNGFERVYMPGDATILGYGGYDVPQYNFRDHSVPHPLTDYGSGHGIANPIALSDVPGRTMVMGLFDISCHDDANGQPMYWLPYGPAGYGNITCNGAAATNSKTFSIEWYTPNAWTPGANGHGTYSELVEKQAGTENAQGSTDIVTVYVDTSQLRAAQPGAGDWTDTGLRAQALKGAKKAFDGKLEGNTLVSFSF